MSASIERCGALGFRGIAAAADGAVLRLSEQCRERVRDSRAAVDGLIEQEIRAYGVNTGVGALCDAIVSREQQRELSVNLLRSTAIGVGGSLGREETRAIMAAAVNNYAHGLSGVRLEVIDQLLALLNADCIPDVPAQGSVGYLTHMAHIALVLVGEGRARVGGQLLPGRGALHAIGVRPLVLEAKEGLSLINGTPCATGLACLSLHRFERLLDWADAAGAQTFENIGCRIAAFAEEPMSWRRSADIQHVAGHLRDLLAGSEWLRLRQSSTTQDALSLRAMPQVHGAARGVFESTRRVVDEELSAATDNPLVAGSRVAPRVYSQAHAVGAALALALDSLAIAVASIAAISERRTDRLMNPALSRLPAFLSGDAGVVSGLMIAQYTASSLVADNRRLAAPASLDGGVTSAMQEDYLCHATPSALKLLKILDNTETVLAIEILSGAQAADLQKGRGIRAPRMDVLHRAVRSRVGFYADQEPLQVVVTRVRELIGLPLETVLAQFA